MRIGVSGTTLLWLPLVLASCGEPQKKMESTGTVEKDYTEAERAYRAGDYRRAVGLATLVIEKKQDLPKPYFLRAKANYALKKTTEAEADFTRAVETAPERSRSIYHFWRGLFYADEAKPTKALADFDAACKLQVRFPVREYYMECFRERAKTHLALGRFSEAVKDCDFVLSRNPDARTRKEFEALKVQALQKKRSGK